MPQRNSFEPGPQAAKQGTGSRSTFEFPSRVNLSGLSLYFT